MERSGRSSVLIVCLTLALAPAGLASVIQPTAELPPTSGGFLLGEVCVPNLLPPKGACVVGGNLSNFTQRVSTLTADGQEVDAMASFTANLYDFTGGVKGGLLGPLSLTGPVGFLYMGRSSETELGTFSTTMTELMLTGSFNGIPVIIKGDLNKTMGTTTISAAGHDFKVDSFFDVFVEVSINGGPFVPGPRRPFVLTATPEPGTFVLGALGIGVLGLAMRRRRTV